MTKYVRLTPAGRRAIAIARGKRAALGATTVAPAAQYGVTLQSHDSAAFYRDQCKRTTLNAQCAEFDMVDLPRVRAVYAFTGR